MWNFIPEKIRKPIKVAAKFCNKHLGKIIFLGLVDIIYPFVGSPFGAYPLYLLGVTIPFAFCTGCCICLSCLPKSEDEDSRVVDPAPNPDPNPPHSALINNFNLQLQLSEPQLPQHTELVHSGYQQTAALSVPTCRVPPIQFALHPQYVNQPPGLFPTIAALRRKSPSSSYGDFPAPATLALPRIPEADSQVSGLLPPPAELQQERSPSSSTLVSPLVFSGGQQLQSQVQVLVEPKSQAQPE